MQSRAKGIVAIEPKYVPASNNADSYIYFRLRCDMSINGKSQTEFYSIKAFGKVADFLRDNIQMNTELYIEALARSFRYTKHGIDQMRTEFHVFMARIIQTGQSIDTRANETVKPTSTSTVTSLSPEVAQKLKDDMKWQKMSDEEVRTASEKWRTVYAEQKQLHPGNESVLPDNNKNSVEKIPEASQKLDAKNRAVQTSRPQAATSKRPVNMQAWANLPADNSTAAVIVARMKLKEKLSSSGQETLSNAYSSVRG
ncbi:single-stranded DNA-binding protein [Salmonella enterica]|nr:single-stranded DNA-binding protein [Salmonella enterica]